MSRLARRIATAASALTVLVLVSASIFRSVEAPDHGATKPAPSARVKHVGEAVQPSPGSIAGTVRDVDGLPLAGARVCAACASCTLLPHSESLCSVTDEVGTYALSPLPAGAYVVSAAARGFAPASAVKGRPVALPPGKQQTGVDISMTRAGAELSGVVHDAIGGPVPGARIVVTQVIPERIIVDALSDDSGEFAVFVAAGAVTLEASAEGYAPVRKHVVAPARTALQLIPAGRISGQVLTASDRTPVEGVEVIAVPATRTGLDLGARSVSDYEGEFAISGIEPGTYILRAKGGAFQGRSSHPVDLGLGEAVRDVEVFLLAGSEIRGRVVVEGSGDPCRQGFVGLGPPDPTTPRDDKGRPAPTLGPALDQTGPAQFATISGEGEVVFPGVPPGDYYVTLMCLGHNQVSGPSVIHADGQTPIHVEWVVREGSALTVNIVDAAGRPLPFATFNLRYPDPRDGRAAAVMPMFTDTQGTITIPGLSSGEYGVLGDHTIEADPIMVQVRLGQANTATLRAKESGGIELEVLTDKREPVDELHVYAAREGQVQPAAPRSAVAVGQGRYRIAPLGAGQYAVHIADGLNPPIEPSNRKDLMATVRSGQFTKLSILISRAGKISGRVVGSNGEPLSDVWVSARHAGQHGPIPGTSPPRVLTKVDGSFSLDNLAEDGLFVVRADHSKGGSVELQGVSPGSNVELRLPDPASLEGTITHVSGLACGGCAVGIFSAAAGVERTVWTRTDGHFTATGIQPGTVELTAQNEHLRANLSVHLLPGERKQGLQVVLSEQRRW